MDFVQILGCGSALPVGNRRPSSQVIKHREHYFLIDCGEGTQSRLREQKISFTRINHIFISHLHGDHFFGLPGLLSTFHLLGRTKPLKLFGPPGLKEILDLQFKLSATFLKYDLECIVVEPKDKELIFESVSLKVFAIPLNHRIQCSGFIFEEKPKPAHLKVEALDEYQIPVYLRAKIKEGADYVTENGEVIPNVELTTPAAPSVVYAYCSDNRVKTGLVNLLKGVKVLYHETTFMESEKSRAKQTFHSTTKEVAQLAKEVPVKTLLIGHYSARYNDLNPLLQECAEEFQNTVLSFEGMKFHFN